MAVRIALAGNPNCGKTTMFNALTGANQYVGNWPGVTVEKKEGKCKGKKDVIITDLPGVYSLSPYTLEEVVSRDYLLRERPEAIINLVDGTNIERNLYLTTQILELGIPVVIALNMIDVVRRNGDQINTLELAGRMGCEVVETSALKGTGLDEVTDKAIKLAAKKKNAETAVRFADDIEKAITTVQQLIPEQFCRSEQRRWYAIKLIEKDEKVLEQVKFSPQERDTLLAIRSQLEKENDDDAESIITNARYDFIATVVAAAIKKSPRKTSTSDKIDRIITNRILALPIFAAIMTAVYYFSITTIGTMGTDWANDVLFGTWVLPGVQNFLESIGVGSVLIDLVVNGILGGVGTVLGFVPQMACVFLCLSILEDVGYMARVAFIMDRIFRKFGLSGKSFIPLLVSSGCGVPGIMSTKTIENDNDRRLTIMTATFVPCGAKLPVIALIAGVMMGGAWWMAPLIYFIGIAAVLVAAIILKKTRIFAGEAAPFVMELPAYHLPAVKTVLLHVWERLWGYIKKAGTIIFLCCAVMWFLSSYGVEAGAFGLVDDQAHSLLAYVGSAIAWIFIPLGFGNWQAVASIISGFVAKESIVSTISILGAGQELGEDSTALWTSLQNGMLPSAVAAFSFLIFNMLDSPCLAAVGTMAKEMNSRKWTWITILFQNVFAYLVTLMIYQFGMLFAYGTFTTGTIAAIIVLIGMLYALFRRDIYKNQNIAARRSVA